MQRKSGLSILHSNYLHFQETLGCLNCQNYCEFPHAAGEATLLSEGTVEQPRHMSSPGPGQQGERSEQIIYFSTVSVDYSDKKQLRGESVSFSWQFPKGDSLSRLGRHGSWSLTPGCQERKQIVEAKNCGLWLKVQHVVGRDRWMSVSLRLHCGF